MKEKYSCWTSLLHTTTGGFFLHLNDVEWFTIQKVLNIKVQLLNISATHYNGWIFFHLDDVEWFTIQQVLKNIKRKVQPLNITAVHYNGWYLFLFFSHHLNDVEWLTIQQVLNIKEKYSCWTPLLHTTVSSFSFLFHLNDVEWFTIQQVMKKNTSKFSIWVTALPLKKQTKPSHVHSCCQTDHRNNTLFPHSQSVQFYTLAEQPNKLTGSCKGR